MRFIKNIAMLTIVVITWVFLIQFFTVMSSWILTPWDTAIYLPDMGTWQRTLNDFFDSSSGQMLISIIIGILTAVPIIMHYRVNTNLRVIVTNLLVVFAGYFVLLFSFAINNLIFPARSADINLDPFFNHNYNHSIIPLITICLIYMIWFREISGHTDPVNKSKHRWKTTKYNQAIDRLKDSNLATNSITHKNILSSKMSQYKNSEIETKQNT